MAGAATDGGDATGDAVMTDAAAKPGIFILRQTANGAYASSSELDGGRVGAVPYRRASQIRQTLTLDGTSLSLPMEGVPEEAGPEEVLVDDPNAEPDSDGDVPEDKH